MSVLAKLRKIIQAPTTATKKEAVIKELQKVEGGEDYLFNPYLRVPLPCGGTITIIAAIISPKREIWLASDYVTDFVYHRLEEGDVNYSLLIEALYAALVGEEGGAE